MASKTISEIQTNRDEWVRVGPARIDPGILNAINEWMDAHNVTRRGRRGVRVLTRDDAYHFLFHNGLSSLVSDTERALESAK